MPTIDDSNPALARIYDSAQDKWVPLMGVPSPHSHQLDGGLQIGIADVEITNPQDGDILVYSASVQKWINRQP
jgi:hypothetical protein